LIDLTDLKSKKNRQRRGSRLLWTLAFALFLFGGFVPNTIRGWGTYVGPKDLVVYFIIFVASLLLFFFAGRRMAKGKSSLWNKLFEGATTELPRKFDKKKLIIASHNAGKVREIGDLLAPFGVEVVSAGELGLDDPEETGVTFVENAVIKAEAAANATGLPALADDSGLVVHALNGEPGIYSARWAGPQRDFMLAMSKVNEALENKEDRSAHFAATLALCWPDGHLETFEGTVHGTLVWPPRGDQGFGYDPMFLADGQDITFGEMDPAKKHSMSHRADAFGKLVAACFGG